MAEKVSRDSGYRSDTIAISRDLGPLRTLVAQREFLCAPIGSLLRALALKTENFGKKTVVLVERKNGFTKTLFSLFFQGFLPRGWF